MGKKTQAEIDAEEAKKGEERSFLGGIGDFFSGLFSNFGTILLIAAVAIGGYFLLGGDKAKDLLSGLLDKIPGWIGAINSDWEEPVRKFMNKMRAGLGTEGGLSDYLGSLNAEAARKELDGKLSPTLLNILAKDDTTWKTFLDTAKAANGGKFSKPEELTSAPTILAMLKTPKGQDMVGDIFKALNPALAKNQSDADKELWTKMMTAAKGLVNSEALPALFAGTARKTTLEMLASAMPKDKAGNATVTADALDKQLTSLGLLDKNGATPALRTALNNVLGSLETGKVAKFDDVMPILIKSANLTPEAKAALVDEQMPKLNTILGNDKNGQLFRTTFGDDRLMGLAPIAMGNDKNAINAHLVNKDNIAATKDFADKVDPKTLPADLRGPIIALRALPKKELIAVVNNGVSPLTLQAIFTQKDKNGKVMETPDPTFIMSQLQKPSHTEILVKAGIENVAGLMRASAPQYKELLTDKNVFLLAQTAARIEMAETDPKAKEVNRVVFAACVDLMNHKTDRMKNLDATQLQHFFENPTNDLAIRTLVTKFEGKGLDAENAKQLALLKKYWGKNSDEGLGEVFASKEGAEFMKDMLTNDSSVMASIVDTFGATKLALKWKGGKIKENADILTAMHDEMKAPAATPPKGEMVAVNVRR